MGFQDFFRDFKISSEISAKPYEISASGGPLAFKSSSPMRFISTTVFSGTLPPVIVATIQPKICETSDGKL